MSRQERQRVIAKWCADAFGEGQASSVEQRGIRLAEEAIEAAQSAGVSKDMLHKLVDFIYGKPPGELSQELGGVGVCLLAMAAAAQIDADTSEADECFRVLTKPLAFFVARNAAKDAAGFVAGGCLTKTEESA